MYIPKCCQHCLGRRGAALHRYLLADQKDFSLFRHLQNKHRPSCEIVLEYGCVHIKVQEVEKAFHSSIRVKWQCLELPYLW